MKGGQRPSVKPACEIPNCVVASRPPASQRGAVCPSRNPPAAPGAVAPAPSDFIRDIVADDVATGRCGVIVTCSRRNQRLPAHRPCQVDLPEFRNRAGKTAVQLRFDDTNPVMRRRLRRLDHRRCPLADRRLGRSPRAKVRGPPLPSEVGGRPTIRPAAPGTPVPRRFCE